MELKRLLERRNKPLEIFLKEENISCVEDLIGVCAVLKAELDQDSIEKTKQLLNSPTPVIQITETETVKELEEPKEVKNKKRKEVIIADMDK